jgi:hypothetical protein
LKPRGFDRRFLFVCLFAWLLLPAAREAPAIFEHKQRNDRAKGFRPALSYPSTLATPRIEISS